MSFGARSAMRYPRTDRLYNPWSIAPESCVGWWRGNGPITQDGVTDRIQLWEPPVPAAASLIAARDLGQATDAEQPAWEPTLVPYYTQASQYHLVNTADSAVYDLPGGEDTSFSAFFVFSVEDTGNTRTFMCWADTSVTTNYTRFQITASGNFGATKRTPTTGTITGNWGAFGSFSTLHAGVVVVTGTSWKVWVDGSSLGTRVLDTSSLDNLDTFALGARVTTSANHGFDGWMPDSAIYAGAISDAAVADLTNYARWRWGTA